MHTANYVVQNWLQKITNFIDMSISKEEKRSLCQFFDVRARFKTDCIAFALFPIPSEVTLPALGVAEVGVAEVGVAELGVAELGVAELGVAELGVAELEVGTEALETLLFPELTT